MSDLNLPTLDIEDLDMDEIEESQKDELLDDAGGSLTYGIVGSGQGGGRIAKAFYDLGYTKTVCFNLAQSDLNFLELQTDINTIWNLRDLKAQVKTMRFLRKHLKLKAKKSSTSSKKFLEMTLIEL